MSKIDRETYLQRIFTMLSKITDIYVLQIIYQFIYNIID